MSEENKNERRAIIKCKCELPVYNGTIIDGKTVWVCEHCGGEKPDQ